jgi:FlaG/FlaF family flagellin (archaellin)
MTEKLKRSFREKRAITPVLSNILLMVVAVAAMAIATTATYVITTNLRETMSERIIAEDLWFNNSTGDIKVYLSNVGEVAVQVSAVYVNHTKQSFGPAPFIMEIGAHNWLSILSSWSSGNLYYVDIVTTRGTHVAEYYEAP